jgi:hypothetical protein
MNDKCGCGHDHCDDEMIPTHNLCDCNEESDLSPHEKIESLKNAIQNLGFSIEETEGGDIKISQ